ncbi:hypothetical protein F8M41_007209 [Gigaspora margarita]|uniref:Uncharacterized protein n=1 Tax=Gigaspora margarita TaxID=4874 RepID=A0A8H4A5H5_GIGMA|nr:hypothetical protein F8M41_007209 [Gigaspora margarita]
MMRKIQLIKLVMRPTWHSIVHMVYKCVKKSLPTLPAAPSNQSIILLVAEIKTDLHSLPQPTVINIKFLSENSYLVQQHSVDSHEWTQVIDDSNRGPKQDQNMLENPGSVTIVEAQSETNSNTNRTTLANDCFFDIDL